MGEYADLDTFEMYDEETDQQRNKGKVDCEDKPVKLKPAEWIENVLYAWGGVNELAMSEHYEIGNDEWDALVKALNATVDWSDMSASDELVNDIINVGEDVCWTFLEMVLAKDIYDARAEIVQLKKEKAELISCINDLRIGL